MKRTCFFTGWFYIVVINLAKNFGGRQKSILNFNRKCFNRIYGPEIIYRMDRIDMEPGDRVRKDQSGLFELLCGTDGETPSCYGTAELCGRI